MKQLFTELNEKDAQALSGGQTKPSLIIIAEDIEGEALATLNVGKGVLLAANLGNNSLKLTEENKVTLIGFGRFETRRR